MDDIPEDVMKAAIDALGALDDKALFVGSRVAEDVARAIMAERERCAAGPTVELYRSPGPMVSYAELSAELSTHSPSDQADKCMESEMKWQPIDTAPKDGSLALLWDEDAGHHDLGFWSSTHECWLETPNYPDVDAAYDVVGTTIYLPTHWMPLPAPPNPSPSDQADQ